ncbi:tryptophan--tRNA ligase [Pseudomonadota bacterium]
MGKVFSGIQPSGSLHLGNYLGAIKNWLPLQEQHDCMFCVVDLHAITVPQNPKELKESIREIAIVYMACGIDPKKSILYQQSRVCEHSELAWIFNCITPVGWMRRMTQFKDKSKKYGDENVTMGLFDYPVLMAADILLYDTDLVPVGEDQTQHVEITRDIAIAFNTRFDNDYFKLPKVLSIKETTRIMSLRDGTKKMSKSDESEQSCIYLSDSPEEITKKIKRAKTDFDPEFIYDKKTHPEITNLLNIYSSLSGEKVNGIINRYNGKGFGVFKADLAEIVVESLKPISNKIDDLKKNVDFVDSVLNEGSIRAKEIAEVRVKEIKKIVGFF